MSPTVPALLALAALLAPAAAQLPGWGSCPEPTVKQDFDISQYLGEWYELERYWGIVFELGHTCVRANYVSNQDGTVNITNKAYNQYTWSNTESVGVATSPDAGEPAKMAVNFGYGVKAGPYWVLDTDYTTYAVVYSCSEYAYAHADMVWILGREASLPADKVTELKAAITAQGLRTATLGAVDHEGCDGLYG